ncbi:MAG TPA: hypothetical protein VGO56_08375 [Pyrinomonadaceae bacterium]|jgi:hypothetical protein|nr:hypothetical protein [Pyrinomonadaceae bacterium]
MKTCPSCNRTYTDASLNFCLEDGTPLINTPAPGVDLNATIRYTAPRDTGHPPAEVVRQAVPPSYQSPAPVASHGSAFGQQQLSNLSVPGRAPGKSKAIGWVLGGILVIGVIGVGAVVMIIAIASLGANSNANSNRGNNNRIVNRNANANTNVANANTNASVPVTVTDDFSEQKWTTGNYAFGDIWYSGDEYHMRAKAEKYLVMYAPSQDYKTGNATVSVTARSVDGTPASTGFGLIIHGERSKTNELEDYALLIFTGAETKYEIVKHKDGKQTALVPWTKTTSIHSGASPNTLEVRAKGTDITFYINGEYVDRITDSENFKGGIAGLYTSDTTEIAFDDLEIKR